MNEDAIVAPDFQQYFAIFIAGGKALNEVDMRRAAMQWVSMTIADRILAIKDATRVCILASHPNFVPLPINHLLGRGWTREAMERTLPTVTRKQLADAEQSKKVQRSLSDRARRRVQE